MTDSEIEPNALLYKFLKKSVSGSTKEKNKVRQSILKCLLDNQDKKIEQIRYLLNKIINNSNLKDNTKDELFYIVNDLNNECDVVSLRFALMIVKIKNILLAKAKTIKTTALSDNAHPLSLEYDSIGHDLVFYKRAYTALLSLSYFKKMSDKCQESPLEQIETKTWEILYKDFNMLQSIGVEVNQMFSMLLLESMQQSGRYSSGQDYEKRIRGLLTKEESSLKIKKHVDSTHPDLEYDLFFNYNNRNYGIGAKRTLRERYKQFQKKDNADADIFIAMTIGSDLHKNKSDIITNNGIYIFVADEVYNTHDYMQSNLMIFKASDFNLKKLEELE